MTGKRKISELHGPITLAFLEECRRYNFHFLCEDCAFFDPTEQQCVHGYPNDEHRTAYFEQDPLGKVLIFCREFELV